MSSVDKRQFIISDRKIERPGFQYKNLGQGKILSYERSLEVREIEDAAPGHNEKGILLGLAFPIDNQYPVTESNGYPIEERIKKWSGRFAAYVNGRIYTDCVCSLSLFYLYIEGEWVVSGSMHLLSEIYGLSRNDDGLVYSKAGRKRGTFLSDFYPGPFTPIPQVRRLMVYEYLDYNSKDFVNKRQREWNSSYQGTSPDELNRIFSNYCKCLYENIAQKYKYVHIPLTGGVDSRTSLALAKYSGIDFAAYTEKRSKKTHQVKTSGRELQIAKRAAEAVGAEWKLCKNVHENKEKYKDIRRHSFEMLENASLHSYAYHQFPEKEGKNIIIHSSVWESTAGVWCKRIRDCSAAEERKKAMEEACPYMQESNLHRRSLLQWVEDLETAGIKGLSLAEMCHLDQKTGVWAGDLAQAMDILDFDRIELINNYELLSILMAYPREWFKSKKMHQKYLIQYCAPKLAAVPYYKKSKWVIRAERICFYLYRPEDFWKKMKNLVQSGRKGNGYS